MKVKNSRHNNYGMTMLETLAAFTILMIITASLVGIIQFASNMSMDAVERRRMSEALNEKLAHKTEDTAMTPAFTKVEAADGMQSSVTLVLDEARTSSANYSGGEDVAIELKHCDVYQLPFPSETEPEITVLRFEYRDSAY